MSIKLIIVLVAVLLVLSNAAWLRVEATFVSCSADRPSNAPTGWGDRSGSYDGVDVCSNGPYFTYRSGQGSGFGAEWQCIELIQRYFRIKTWTNVNTWGNGNADEPAYQFFDDHPQGLTSVPNASLEQVPREQQPREGDALVFNWNDSWIAGHIALITRVNRNPQGDITSIAFVQQNVGANWSDSMAVKDNHIVTKGQASSINYPAIRGWIHAAMNTGADQTRPFWVEPDDGTVVTGLLSYDVRIPQGPLRSLQRVEFTAWYNGAKPTNGPNSWQVIGTLQGRSDFSGYGWNWYLDNVPDGDISISFDLYFKDRPAILAPDGIRRVRKCSNCILGVTATPTNINPIEPVLDPTKPIFIPIFPTGGGPCSLANNWTVGSIVGLKRGAEIWQGEGMRGNVVVVPDNAEQPWNVKVIGGPRCVGPDDWYNIDRRAAGDPSGGTGWVNRTQAQYAADASNPGPRPTPSDSPFGSCDGVTSGAYMYSDQQGRGDCVRISQAIPNLDSVRIEGKKVNDWINSIHLVGINFVRVCEDSGGGGKCLSVTSDKDSLAPDSMEHKTSSVYFTSNTPTGPTDANCTSGQMRVEFYTDKNFANIGTVKCREYSGTGEFVEGGSYAWGPDSGPPELGGQGGNFSIRWRGTFNYTSGRYHCFTSTDDGSMLYFDSVLKVDNGGDHSRQRRDGDADLAAGLHELRIDYQQGGGEGAVSGDCQRSGDIAGTPIPPATSTPTPTSTPLATATPIPGVSPTPTVPPGATSTPTQIPLPTATFTPLVPPTATWTPEPGSTSTPTPTPSPTATYTPLVPPTATWTPVVPPTPTWTPLPPTATWTPIPTATFTPTPTRTPTPTPTQTPVPLTGNVARVATITGGNGCGSILTDGSLAQTCHAGSSIQFTWNRSALVSRTLMFNNGGVNWVEVFMSDGTHIHADFGGPNTCAQWNFTPRNVTWVRFDFNDGIPSTMKEIEVWVGPGSSNNTCGNQRTYP